MASPDFSSKKVLGHHQGRHHECYTSLGANLHWLNSANVVLMPHKEGAEGVSEYWPISLIDAIAKIIEKILATRLRPHMDALVSYGQSAFIKRRSIHDNFMRNLVRHLHKSKTPSLLFKMEPERLLTPRSGNTS